MDVYMYINTFIVVHKTFNCNVNKRQHSKAHGSKSSDQGRQFQTPVSRTLVRRPLYKDPAETLQGPCFKGPGSRTLHAAASKCHEHAFCSAAAICLRWFKAVKVQVDPLLPNRCLHSRIQNFELKYKQTTKFQGPWFKEF
jgi:hypothetical protein